MSSTLLLPHAHSFVIGPAVINTHISTNTVLKAPVDPVQVTPCTMAGKHMAQTLSRRPRHAGLAPPRLYRRSRLPQLTAFSDATRKARREETIFRHLLHCDFSPFCHVTAEASGEFCTACWLQELGKNSFLALVASATASKSGLCRGPHPTTTLANPLERVCCLLVLNSVTSTPQCARNAPCLSRCEPLWRDPHGREHPGLS